jgi:hypothetical protein
MPIKNITVKNPKLLSFRGITAYHTYRNDDADDCLRDFWYTQDPWSNETRFDVRTLSTCRSPGISADQDGVARHKRAIREAIAKGEIKPWPQ